MNERITNESSGPSSLRFGDVLSTMIQRLEAGNSNLVGQIREVGLSTNSTLGKIGQSVASTTQTSSPSSTGKDLLNAFNPLAGSKSSSVLTSLFLGPVWKGLFSLFNRSGDGQPAPPTKYAFPQETRSDLNAALRGDGQNVGVRSDAFGLSQATPQAPASITISIQALDARSILDRSDDIAAALKQAMLSNHDINDNLNEI